MAENPVMFDRGRPPALDGAVECSGEPCDITVILLGELKRLAGVAQVTLRLPANSTVHDVARRLRTVCAPPCAQRVLTLDGDLQPHVAVFLDGAQLPATRGAPAPLGGGRLELMLVPMYEGG
jgi:hypothetical protein